ncbi:hypothetical protein WDU94_004832 [Cyamophila willieti]
MASSTIKFIDNLPYQARHELCKILDLNNDWKILGGILDFKIYEISQIENAIFRRGSPTDELLSKITSKNFKISKLFKHLYEMKHFQAMLVLKPYVDSRHHVLIPDITTTTNTILENALKINVQDEALLKKENDHENQIGPEFISKDNYPNAREVWDPLASSNVNMNMLGCTPRIPYDELKVATNHWNQNNILGKGGFGIVYKGLWKKTHIAIKVLKVQKRNRLEKELSKMEQEQSLRELKYLNSCRHDNILPLYGICFESGKYCLIYQYMKNGSLEDRLEMKGNTLPLLWRERLNIARGTALGLQFLHDREPPLIHGDIKSANILLNAYMNPVIGDFGLAREGPIEKATHITLSRVSGTRPYLPIEYLMDKTLSTKVDVYSFGIVLFELATGMGPFDVNRVPDMFLRDFVLNYERNNKGIHALVDKNSGVIHVNIAYIFFNIGKLCVNFHRNTRPEMSQVCTLLEAGSDQSDEDYELLPRPIRPAASPPLPRPPPPGIHIPLAPVLNQQRNQLTDDWLYPRLSHAPVPNQPTHPLAPVLNQQRKQFTDDWL